MEIVVKNKGQGVMTIEGACVDIEMLVLGPIQNNVYLISDGQSLICVDPACNVDRILKAIDGRKLDAIFATHHHDDHVGALKELRDATGAPVYASAIDARVIEDRRNMNPMMPAPSCPVDHKLVDKEKFSIGNMVWKTMVTPGHTEGGICLFLSSEDGNHPEGTNVLVSGDTLFAGSIGRTDFPGGDDNAMRASLRRLRELPDDTLVLPGHNTLTTIGKEQNRVFRFFI